MQRWEYATLYLKEAAGHTPERWVLFGHPQDPALLAQFPALPDSTTPTSIRFDYERARTSLLMGILGEDGWELVSVTWLPALEAACLYFKKALAHDRPLWTGPPGS